MEVRHEHFGLLTTGHLVDEVDVLCLHDLIEIANWSTHLISHPSGLHDAISNCQACTTLQVLECCFPQGAN